MKRLVFLLLLTTFMASCSEDVSYSLITSNRSTEVIDEVQVWFGDKPVNNGILSPDVNKTILSSIFKLKEQMKITWVDSDNKPHKKTFKTFDHIPQDYNGGNVIFIYHGNDKFTLKFHMPKNDFPKLFDD